MADDTQAVLETAASLVHPHQMEVQDFSSYALIIDARSPREYAADHIPGAVNLPVVNDAEYAEVGTRYRTDRHAAYLIGVEHSLLNIAAQIRMLISQYGPEDRILAYCFRGGKRSRLWADNLRTIGFEVDVLAGGWKSYRHWVIAGLESLPRAFSYRVLCGATGCGKTRLLLELERQGQQVLELEGLAQHRGSLLGDLPGQPQPTQRYFDTLILDRLRSFDARRTVWLEAESKKIGKLQVPASLFDAMHRAPVVNVTAPMPERVRLWLEDYPHFSSNPVAMIQKLAPLKPLVGGDMLKSWQALAATGRVEELFESIMRQHYDPCYARSTRLHFGPPAHEWPCELASLEPAALAAAVRRMTDALSD